MNRIPSLLKNALGIDQFIEQTIVVNTRDLMRFTDGTKDESHLFDKIKKQGPLKIVMKNKRVLIKH